MRPSWYYNHRDDPEVRIRVRGQVMRVRATTVGPERRAELWARLTMIFPAYESHQQTAGREFPVVAFTPTGEQRSVAGDAGP